MFINSINRREQLAANGISTLLLKRDRQNAKLAAAAIKRGTTGRRNTLNIDQLPTVYNPTTNDPDQIVDNDNIGGLVTGRPWT